MAPQNHIHPADIFGLGRLGAEATVALTDLTEALHTTIVRAPMGMSIAGLVYDSIRGIAQLIGNGLNMSATMMHPLLPARQSSPERERVIAALNGVIGDYLVASHNPLAIPMQLRRDTQALELHNLAAAEQLPQASGKILVLVHGLCLADRHWQWQGHNHGTQLAADLGYTPVYLNYNTGLHISTNGQAFAEQLDMLLRHWPVQVEELAIVAHSMGGLVTRSACSYGAAAGHEWLNQLRALVFLCTPHQGAPLEQIGNWVNVQLEANPYTAAFARVGKLRSAGITDLRYGNLRDEDWAMHDRFAHADDQRQPIPLPSGVRCYAIGATLGNAPGDIRDQLLGDGLVPLPSALGKHPKACYALDMPTEHQWVGYALNHLDVLARQDVYAQLRTWLSLR